VGDELAMFPLGSVVLPGELLPLHVFEPRYRELVRRCLEGTPEFGVALIERGSEVGGGDVRFDSACVVRIVEAVSLPDGRWAVVVAGTDRIRVVRWLSDDPYPRAEVAAWPDADPGPGAELVDRCEALVPQLERVLALAAELSEARAPVAVELPDDPVRATYHLASLAPLGPLDRLALLAADTPGARLDALDGFLDDAATVLASRLGGI
jgi:uncharacterized protein